MWPARRFKAAVTAARNFETPLPAQFRLPRQLARGFTRIVDGGLRELGLAAGQLPVLVSLKKSKALSQAELARIAQVEQPSMAQLLARMERDGLVERVDDPEDKRSRLISLTPLAAKRLAHNLGAELVDDNKRPLDDAALASIRKQVDGAAEALRESGIEPGSPRALALFGA